MKKLFLLVWLGCLFSQLFATAYIDIYSHFYQDNSTIDIDSTRFEIRFRGTLKWFTRLTVPSTFDSAMIVDTLGIYRVTTKYFEAGAMCGSEDYFSTGQEGAYTFSTKLAATGSDADTGIVAMKTKLTTISGYTDDIGTAGNGLTNIPTVATVTNVGTVTGNVNGSVGSVSGTVTANVASVDANAIASGDIVTGALNFGGEIDTAGLGAAPWGHGTKALTDKAGFGLADGAITSAKFATGAIGSTQLADEIELTSLLINNTGGSTPALRIIGASGYDGIQINASGNGGDGIHIDKTSGTGSALAITNAGAGTTVNISNSSTGAGLTVDGSVNSDIVLGNGAGYIRGNLDGEIASLAAGQYTKIGDTAASKVYYFAVASLDSPGTYGGIYYSRFVDSSDTSIPQNRDFMLVSDFMESTGVAVWDEDSTGHYTSPKMAYVASQTGGGGGGITPRAWIWGYPVDSLNDSAGSVGELIKIRADSIARWSKTHPDSGGGLPRRGEIAGIDSVRRNLTLTPIDGSTAPDGSLADKLYTDSVRLLAVETQTDKMTFNGSNHLYSDLRSINGDADRPASMLDTLDALADRIRAIQATAGVHGAKFVYVDDDGDNSAGTNWDNAWTSISKACSACVGSNECYVSVAPGLYENQRINIMSDAVHLIGSGSGETFLTGIPSAGIGVINASVSLIPGEIAGFAFDGDSVNNEIINLWGNGWDVHDCRFAGILVPTSEGEGQYIWVVGDNSKIHDNIFASHSSARRAIKLNAGVRQTRIYDNVFNGAYAEAVITMLSGSDNNYVYDNRMSVTSGLLMYCDATSDSNLFMNNWVDSDSSVWFIDAGTQNAFVGNYSPSQFSARYTLQQDLAEIEGGGAGADTAAINAMLIAEGYAAEWDQIALIGACAGSGAEACTLYVMDGGTPVQGVYVRANNSGETSTQAIGTTDLNGLIIFNLDSAIYKVRVYKAGVTQTTNPQSVIVTASGANDTIAITQFSPTLPSEPSLCAVYGSLYGTDGNPIAGAIISLTLTNYSDTLNYGNAEYVNRVNRDITDANGNWQIDVVPNVLLDANSKYMYKVEKSGILLTPKTKEVTVPQTTSARIETLF